MVITKKIKSDALKTSLFCVLRFAKKSISQNRQKNVPQKVLTARCVQFYREKEESVMSSKNLKTLQELCCELKVTRRVIQGYEKAGLVSATNRNKYGHLLYDEKSQQRIKQIRLYQRLGFSIRKIMELIDAPVPIVRDALEKQMEHLQEERKNMDMLISMVHELIRDMEEQLK